MFVDALSLPYAAVRASMTVAGAGGWFNDFVLPREICAKRLEQFIESKEHECPTWNEGEPGRTPMKRPGRGKFDQQDYKDWPLVSKILLWTHDSYVSVKQNDHTLPKMGNPLSGI